DPQQYLMHGASPPAWDANHARAGPSETSSACRPMRTKIGQVTNGKRLPGNSAGASAAPEVLSGPDTDLRARGEGQLVENVLDVRGCRAPGDQHAVADLPTR